MGSGYRTFTAGEVLTASNVQNYLQDQVVMTFGGSAARSSAIGTANFEEGMISYLTDTDKVEAYNGTNWVQVGASTQGLTLINTTSFSGVTSQSFNSLFNANYDNYKVVINLETVGTYNSITARLRSSGTDASGSNYSYYGMYVDSSSGPTRDVSVNNTSFSVADANSGGGFAIIDIANPFLAKRTFYNSTRNNATSANTGFQFFLLGGCHSLTNSYDGITFLFASAQSGTIRVYGYNN
jgi:hypothetical protein